jgi:hypothetical protein
MQHAQVGARGQSERYRASLDGLRFQTRSGPEEVDLFDPDGCRASKFGGLDGGVVGLGFPELPV